MVKIRLKRVGKKKQPSYRVVVADSRSPRDGRIIEAIGHYQPRLEPSEIVIDNERAVHWLKVGAQPSEQVRKLLEISAFLEPLSIDLVPQSRLGIAEADLPSGEAKLQIMTLAINRLRSEGYVYIGFDHFARPDDALAVAQAQGRLQRNFQGYSTHADCDMLGLGISSIGRVGPTYYQNVKNLKDYYALLDEGRLPVVKGMELSPDDLVRRTVIHALACNFHVAFEAIELAHHVDFRSYFQKELEDLQKLAADGLVELEPGAILVTPRGRLMVRTVCMVFDRYLREKREQSAKYSKVL